MRSQNVLWSLLPLLLWGCSEPVFSGQDAGDGGGQNSDNVSTGNDSASETGQSTSSSVSSSRENASTRDTDSESAISSESDATDTGLNTTDSDSNATGSNDTPQTSDNTAGSDSETSSSNETPTSDETEDSDTAVESDTETEIVSTVCSPNESRRCLNALGNCADGLETCLEDGSGWGECSIQPAAEDGCEDGDDANCNGTANEGCACTEGEERNCGPANEIGICVFGVTRCENNNWTTCEGAVTPGLRSCLSTDDNDCNGTYDNEEETCLCDPAGPARDCDPYGKQGEGICLLGRQACIDNGDGTSDWEEGCNGAVEPQTEVCDEERLDEDCDGTANEGCSCTDGATQTCGTNEGECVAGEQSCVNGTWSEECEGETPKASRNCTSDKDNDCNGTIDNEETNFCKCDPDGQPLTCDPYGMHGLGICTLGTRECELSADGTTSDWATDCVGAIMPQDNEICDNNQLDENCNDEIDEGCHGKPCVNDSSCQAGLSCVANGGAKLGIMGSVCLPSHCNNNVQDSGESSVDCGGECGCRASIEWFAGTIGVEGMSDNGEYIVGYKRATSSSSAYGGYWDPSLTQWELDTDLDSGSTYAYGVNANGNVFVGSASGQGPVRWINRSQTPQSLDSGAYESGSAYAASASGGIVVGSANDGTSNAAFYWDNGNNTWVYDFYSFVEISSDGTVALGLKSSSGPPALWTPTGETIEIPLSGDWSHQGWCMSRDANYVSGAIYSDAEGNMGYLWDRSSGMTMFTGMNDGTPYPAAVANTGRIVGQTGRGGMPAEYWDESTNYVPRLIADLVADMGYELSSDYELREPKAITPDGKVIVGFGLTPGEEHIYKLTLDE